MPLLTKEIYWSCQNYKTIIMQSKSLARSLANKDTPVADITKNLLVELQNHYKDNVPRNYFMTVSASAFFESR